MTTQKPSEHPKDDDEFINNLNLGTDEFELKHQSKLNYYVSGPGKDIIPLPKSLPKGLRDLIIHRRKERASKDQEQ